ncbi:hypothetical protein [Ammoniphilus resinae]|uniref:Uncharacterized protein n=1 Tax=Ammoniphilus resinae TaxID=861532 RepID=A0ABS4GT97_9BACL|nr:hypothetical protein [Ammoniphilus resinae]MBP1933479.1 hypothetical protein [Ammoniphilus resinae]
MRRDKYPSYEERFRQFSNSIEKAIILVIIFLVLLLMGSQLLLYNDTFRGWIVEVEQLEGVAS